MPLIWRVVGIFAGVAAVVALVLLWGIGFLRTSPPTAAASVPSAGQADVTMQTVGSIGFGPRPTWVSYLIRDASGKWVHTTLFRVPAHSLVHFTVFEYDSTGTLRNPYWATVTGTGGAVERVTGTVDDRKGQLMAYHVLPADAAAHTFSIPAMGVNVPLAGYSGNATLCSVAPCSPKFPHDVDTFTIRTGAPGVYRWQCFMPCGLGFHDGNGGPMQSIGYMMGFMKVVG